MIHELIDLSEWKRKNQCLKELALNGIYIDERRFRALIKKQNQLFFNHEIDIFIAHSSKGYKATKDEKEILNSIADNRKRALNMLYEESKIKKALGENYNLHLTIRNGEFICTEF